MLDGSRDCALAPGELDAPSTRDLHCNSSRLRTRAPVDLPLRQSCKLQALSAALDDSAHRADLSTRIRSVAFPCKRTGAYTTQTFVFGGELANTVVDFLSDFKSPTLRNLNNFLECGDDRIADIIITTHNGNTIRQLTLLGPDAEDVSSYLAFCFEYQLTSGPKELCNEPVSFTR
jgi:hypothetical protein